MKGFEFLNVNDYGNLTVGGLDSVELTKKFGTPLYVMDEDVLRKNCRRYEGLFKKYYHGRGMALYASKALSCIEICRIIKDEGLGLDVVSGGELYTALKADFPVGKIHFHGNNKTVDEITFAIDSGVGRIVVDNVFELEIIDSIARKKGIVVNIALRVKPGITTDTHRFIKTGGVDSKFGFNINNGEALEAVKFAKALQNVELRQLHCHIGSQIFDVHPFVKSAETMMKFINDIHRTLMINIPELNLGGGFGVKYTFEDSEFEFERCIKEVCDVVRVRSEQYGIEAPFVYVEPGRSIVGDAGVTLYKVGAIKEIEEIKTYVSVDGGMSDNPRRILYDAEYSILIANKVNELNTKVVTVAGKCCESGDIIAENVKIPEPEIGDVVAVLSTGAYNYSMASNYNRLPRPPIVMIKDKEARTIVKRETYEDLVKNDL